MSGLKARLAREIALTGPMPVDAYVTRCLHDPRAGYYSTRPEQAAILGAGGDFVTAPLVSQMFGELIGLWAVETWRRLGAPDRLRLVEVGPGDGTLMIDALRAARVDPDFLLAVDLVLIEPSAPLRAIQARTLAGTDRVPRWVSDLSEVETDAPMLLIANEVLDCLPARQFVRSGEAWMERCVITDGQGGLAFALSPITGGFQRPDFPVEDGQVVETSAAQAGFARAIAEHLARSRGAALLIDYGRDRPGPGDTLQALRRHEKVDPLAEPGLADVTQWADFPAVMEAAIHGGADVTGCLGQGGFLKRLGIEARAQRLIQARPEAEAAIRRQLDRLIAPGQMGELFKACAIFAPRSLAVPGFEAP